MRLWLLPIIMLTVSACAQAKPSKAPKSFCNEQVFQGSHFTVCDNLSGGLRLFAAGKGETPVRSFAGLMREVDADRVAFAMNAGMFDEQGRPIGYAVVDGRDVHKLNLRDGPGNFHLRPNGVFIGGCGRVAAMVIPSEAVAELRCKPRFATQSGPMLVIDDKLHPKLQADGQSRLIRNGVGVRDGKAVFVISESAVSLGKFARFFRDALKTPDALYFDGSVSSLWDPTNGRQDSHTELGPIVVALKPEASEPGRGGRARP